jgi:hypothetical protein
METLEGAKTIPPKFTDVTSVVNLSFKHLASHTSRKYLLETMGAGSIRQIKWPKRFVKAAGQGPGRTLYMQTETTVSNQKCGFMGNFF